MISLYFSFKKLKVSHVRQASHIKGDFGSTGDGEC